MLTQPLKPRKTPLLQLELVRSLKGYRPKFLLKDLLAGLMVALVALPLNLAMGTRQTYEGFEFAIQIGLWTAIVGGILLAVFGGSKFSIGSPTAPFITVIVMLLAFSGNSMHNIFLSVALAGVILIVAALFKVGKLLKFVSYPVVIGICLGIGVALLFNLVSDMGLILGPHTDLTRTIDGFSPFIARLIRTGTGFSQFTSSRNIANLIAGVVAAVLVYVLPKIHKKIPSIIVAILVSTGIAYLLGLITPGYDGFLQPFTVGRHLAVGTEYHYLVPTPAWGTHFIRFDQINLAGFALPATIMFAFAIAIIAALEGMMSATAVENISKIKYHANTELFGHGVANVGSGLLGGLPITAAMARTNLNYENGAKSPLSGIFQSLYLLLFYALLIPFLRFIPIAALVAPLVKVAITTGFYPQAMRLMRFSKRDCVQVVLTGLITIVFGVHFGVIAGIVSSFLVNISSFKHKMKLTQIRTTGTLKRVSYYDFNTLIFKTTGVKVVSVLEDDLIEPAVKGEGTGDRVQGTGNDLLVADLDGVGEVESGVVVNDGDTALLAEVGDGVGVELVEEKEEIFAPVFTKTLRIEGAVFFANAHKLVQRIKEMIQNADEIVLDFAHTHSIDATVGERLAKLIKAAAKADKHIVLKNADRHIKKVCIKSFNYIIKSW